MAYEVSCPSCHVRLQIRDDGRDRTLICPRCLGEVPHPGAKALDTRVTAQPPRAVPTVETEARHSSWTAYFVILAMTVASVFGVLLAVNPRQGNSFDIVLPLLFGLVIVLTILVLYPVGRGLWRAAGPKPGAAPGQRALRTAGVIALLVVIAPLAFFITFFAVCSATLAVLSVR